MKSEFTIEQIRNFVSKGYTSVSARFVKSALYHIDTRANELEIAYLKGFRDGFGIDDNAVDSEDFPEGCSDINQVWDRIEELEAALNPAKVLQKDCS